MNPANAKRLMVIRGLYHLLNDLPPVPTLATNATAAEYQRLVDAIRAEADAFKTAERLEGN